MTQADNVIAIFGKRGSGKSTLTKKVIARHARVIVFDPMGEYYGGLVCRTFLEFAEFCRDPSPEFFVALRFREDTVEETQIAYEYAARLLWVLGDLLLVLEEAEIFLSSYNTDSYLNYLVSFGRHRRISILAIGRRPSEIPIRIRSNTSTVVSFAQNEPRDIAYLESWGFDAAELVALKPYEYRIIGHDITQGE